MSYGATDGRLKDPRAEDDYQNRLCSLGDLPALGMPWFLFAMVLVPASMGEGALLSIIAVGSGFLLSMGFLLFSKGAAWRVLAITCMVFSLLGLFIGRYNRYKFISEYSIYEYSPHFSDVMPSANPGAFRDAGHIEFSEDAFVDTRKSVGYVDDRVWCVAPVLSQNSPSHQVGFWAVGQDCCDPRGGFHCGDLSGSSGLVVLDTDHLMNPSIPSYRTAAQMAAATYALNIPEDPIFVRWGVGRAEAQRENLGGAFVFVIFTLLSFLLVIPLFIVLLTVANLSLIKVDNKAVKDMTFGVECSNRPYTTQVQLDLLHQRVYWSGEVIYDYAFHLANKHMFLGPFFCHPMHPFSKWERGLVLVVVCLLMLFPVAAFSVACGRDTMIRQVVVLLVATIPRNLLKLYMINLSQTDSKLELEEGKHDEITEEKIRQAASYEYIFLSVTAIVTGIICAVCGIWISHHSDKTVVHELATNSDGVLYSFVLEILFDLFIPYFGPGEYSHHVTLGFFGRWSWEKEDFDEGRAMATATVSNPKSGRLAAQRRRLAESQGGAGSLLTQSGPDGVL